MSEQERGQGSPAAVYSETPARTAVHISSPCYIPDLSIKIIEKITSTS